MRTAIIIPALDEAATIGAVVRAIPRALVDDVIVVDNASTDETATQAAAAGARVVHASPRGYGQACLAGIAALPRDTEVVVFMDGDGSDDPNALGDLLAPIQEQGFDFVVGSRMHAGVEAGALTLPQRWGNGLAGWWLRQRFGLPASDLGPFRAIRYTALRRLGMSDPTYGWTVEMQIKAARYGLRYTEIAVPYRCRRGGQSKVSGTLRGVLGATRKILGCLLYHDVRSRF